MLGKREGWVYTQVEQWSRERKGHLPFNSKGYSFEVNIKRKWDDSQGKGTCLEVLKPWLQSSQEEGQFTRLWKYHFWSRLIFFMDCFLILYMFKRLERLWLSVLMLVWMHTCSAG